MSPFYSARTMYGGASALLPYSSQSGAKLRAASTSNLNVFSAKNQITIQPVPSPHKGGANDQETMSAAARKILDTLERYCSPVRLTFFSKSATRNKLSLFFVFPLDKRC